jgi:hypothetical protein
MEYGGNIWTVQGCHVNLLAITKPNLKMEDSGNIWTVQDCHLVFCQTKPEDGGWREYLNCTRLPHGSSWHSQQSHEEPEKNFPTKLDISSLIINTQSHESAPYLVDVLKLRMEFDRERAASAHKWALLKWKTVHNIIVWKKSATFFSTRYSYNTKNVKPLVHTALHFCTFQSVITWVWNIQPRLPGFRVEEYPALGYLIAHVRNIQPRVKLGSNEDAAEEYLPLGHLHVPVRNIQPWTTWVATWGISSPELPGWPLEEYPALCYLSVHVRNIQPWAT